MSGFVERVADHQLKHAVDIIGGYADHAPLDTWLNAIDQCVLQQRLQRQLRNRQVLRHAIDPPVHLQPVAQAVLLDRQVTPRQLQLIPPGHQCARPREARTEQVGQVQYSLLRLGRIARHQCGDAVEAVEQEVRTNARLQRFDPRPQLGLLLAPPLALQIEIA